MAKHFENQAIEFMKTESTPEIRHGEVVPVVNHNDEKERGAFWIKETLLDPDSPAVEASADRSRLLQQASVLELGIDAAASIQARNSIEKMLAHQMAACHSNAMRLIAETTDRYELNASTEMLMIKKINLAARLMDVFQKGMDTLTRTRTAGKQTITVKQVHVTGGQNVIADNVTTGGRERGEG
jgi:hypothetical protein